jgi:hypothetical protein
LNCTTSPSLCCIGPGFHLPGEHLISGDARHFTASAQTEGYAIEFALHYLPVEQRDLAHEAWSNADLRKHLRGVE